MRPGGAGPDADRAGDPYLQHHAGRTPAGRGGADRGAMSAGGRRRIPLRSAPIWCARMICPLRLDVVPARDPRRALLAVYAFNVEISRVRDQVSQPLPGEIRLQWWTDMLEGAGHGEVKAIRSRPNSAGDPGFPPAGRAVVAPIEEHQFDLYNDPMPSMAALKDMSPTHRPPCCRSARGSRHRRGGDRPSRAPRRPRPGHGAGDRLAAARCRAAPAIPAAATAAATRQRDRGSIFRQADAGGRARRSTSWSARRESILRPRSSCSRTCRRRCGRCSATALVRRDLQRVSRADADPFVPQAPSRLRTLGRCGMHRGRASLAGRTSIQTSSLRANEAIYPPHKERIGLLSLRSRDNAGVSTVNSARCSRN